MIKILYYRFRSLIRLFMFLFLIIMLSSCSTSRKTNPESETPTVINTHQDAEGIKVELHFTKGKSFNHPLMAAWVETEDGEYMQTLYVAESIAKGVFGYGDKSSGKWMPGEIRRPATLPYWSHKRGVQEADGLFIPTAKTPMPDAVTSATPKGNFVLHSVIDNKGQQRFKVLFEINQSWDWNEYWTNNKFPDDQEYKTSSQPAVVYAVTVDINDIKDKYTLEAIGHSHHSGTNGKLFSDLSTLTTAMQISKEISMLLKKK